MGPELKLLEAASDLKVEEMTGVSEKLAVIAATALQYSLDAQAVLADLHAILQRVPRNTDDYVLMRAQELVARIDSFQTVFPRRYHEGCARLGSHSAE